MNFLDMLGVAECQNNSMLCFCRNLVLVKFTNKLKGGSSRICGIFVASVDSETDLVSA